MTPNRKDWPLQYRILARLAMGALALLVMGYLFILHPTRARLERQKAEIEKKTDYLKGMQLPLDSVLLGERLRDAMRLLEGDDDEDMTGLLAVARETLEEATQPLDARIRQNYGDNLAFIYGATRLDSKDLQERIIKEFGEGNPKFLGMNPEEIQEQPVWQTIAKLWTVREILGEARDAGLEVAPPAADGKPSVTAMPIVGYTLDDTSSGSIYLLEFPVNATFSGTLAQFLVFVQSLQDERRFIPLKRLSIRTLPPEALLAGSDNAVDKCLFTVRCCALMAAEGTEPQPPDRGDEVPK